MPVGIQLQHFALRCEGATTVPIAKLEEPATSDEFNAILERGLTLETGDMTAES